MFWRNRIIKVGSNPSISYTQEPCFEPGSEIAPPVLPQKNQICGIEPGSFLPAFMRDCIHLSLTQSFLGFYKFILEYKDSRNKLEWI